MHKVIAQERRRLGFRAAVAALVCLCGPFPARAVTLRVTEATASAQGEMVNVCVVLEGGGVAGTSNDLVWDGHCATLTAGACTANPAHGKSLNTAFPPGTDFTMRAIVLSLSDTKPMGDTELYCCQFRSELDEPGSLCPVNITRAAASDPNGNALSTGGIPGGIRFVGRGGEGAAPRAGGGAPGPLSAVGGPTGAGPARGPGGAPAAGGVVTGGGAPPPAVVLPGGVEGQPPVVQAPAVEPGAETAQVQPPVEVPGAEEVPAATVRATGAAATPAEAAATPAVPEAIATARVGGTPTAKLAPTARPTLKPAAKPTTAPTPAAGLRSWFGCQVVTGGGDCSAQVLIAALGVLAARWQRRRKRAP